MSLTTKDVGIILGMAARGDNKHDIAAWFGVNQARIAEAEQGQYGNVAIAPSSDFFPKGSPGPKARRLRYAVNKAIEALNAGDAAAALGLLNDALVNFNKNEA